MALMANGKKVVGYALGGTEFYSMDGSDTNVTANGKKWCAVPSKITINAGSRIYNGGSSNISANDAGGQTVECVAASNSYYYFVGWVALEGGSGMTYSEPPGDVIGVGVVAKSNCTNIVW